MTELHRADNMSQQRQMCRVDLLRFQKVNCKCQRAPQAGAVLRLAGRVHFVIVLLGIASCGGGAEPCVDSMDCAFGQACRDSKCVVVPCASAEGCVPEVEICATPVQAGGTGDQTVCTAPCNVFHRCPSGQYCHNKQCWNSEGHDSDALDDTASDAQSDVGGPVDAIGQDDAEHFDLRYSGDGPCPPDCSAVECGMDPVCGTLWCGGCGWGNSCVNGRCRWVSAEYTVTCNSNGMCLVPEGSFWMGCNEQAFDDCISDEVPFHEVELLQFFIDRTEVTQGQYKKCVDDGSCTKPSCNWNPGLTPNQPVVCVTWPQAGKYCSWANKRLPTEAEWEKAAKGIDGRIFPWGIVAPTCEYAVLDNGSPGCGTGAPKDVCGTSPKGDSPYGLCDMAGNAAEWVSDWYGPSYYAGSGDSNPFGPEEGTLRVRRGGSYVDTPEYLAVRRRGVDSPLMGYSYLGFRCVADDNVIPGEFGFKSR